MLFDISGHEGRVLLEDLQRHAGHVIGIAQYGDLDTHGKLVDGTLENIGVECLDCEEVIVSVNNYGQEED